jgi:PiT family inorganic phosphate transporter
LELWILILGFAAGTYMAWNIGANDVANAMASAVGAKAITIRQAVFIAGILDFIGATFIGSHVTTTIRKNIIDPTFVQDPSYMMLGFLAALLAASMWVFISTWRQLPVSTTHSIVGAMIGFGIVVGGFSVVRWEKVVFIVISWILSPLLASVLSFWMFRFIRARVLSSPSIHLSALRWSPFFIGVAFFIMLLSLFLKTPLGKRLGIELLDGVLISLAVSLVIAVVGRRWIRSFASEPGEAGAESIFRRLQVMTSCYVALSHGANDVANAIGPVAGIYIIYMTKEIGVTIPVPLTLLAVGGMGIALGVFSWGYRVIETVGTRITTLTNTRGFSVDFGTATCVLLASKLGLPVSTTHAAVGAVIGVGLARGIAAVDFRVIGKIFLYWVVTLPVAAVSCMFWYKLLVMIFM